jgi:peptide/nickel transport system ATP-binding protein
MLDIEDLQINFDTRRGQVKAVQGISLRVERGEILGLVGESGAGKSTVGSAVMGLLDIGGRVTSGRILFEGENLLVKSSEAMRKMRGRRIGMIFQDPMTALNPVLSIADQMIGTIRLAFGLNRSEALEQAVKWIRRRGSTIIPMNFRVARGSVSSLPWRCAANPIWLLPTNRRRRWMYQSRRKF